MKLTTVIKKADPLNTEYQRIGRDWTEGPANWFQPYFTGKSWLGVLGFTCFCCAGAGSLPRWRLLPLIAASVRDFNPGTSPRPVSSAVFPTRTCPEALWPYSSRREHGRATPASSLKLRVFQTVFRLAGRGLDPPCYRVSFNLGAQCDSTPSEGEKPPTDERWELLNPEISKRRMRPRRCR